jgi:malate dehydrogenase (oxaloacetate-decarboxylating)(NADP+)
VNNVYCFPGISFGAVRCKARFLPDSIFYRAAEAVAVSLSAEDIAEGRVVPHPRRIREVGLNVATAVVMECQRLGLAGRVVGRDAEEVRRVLAAERWDPYTVGESVSATE